MMKEYFRGLRENRKKYKGFTLIELLSILLILFIIFTIVIYSFTDVFKSAKETISKADKNTVLSAANDYALEYRGSDGWIEEVKNDGTVNFCVSLNSLIDYGYFKNDSSNFEKYKNEYVVEFQIKNGVSSYRFISRSDSSVCSTREISSSINNSHINTEIKDQKGDSIGEFNYELNRISDKKYSFDFDLSMDLITMRDIYVTLVFDKSQSMMGYSNKYNAAKDAAIHFSEELINKNKETRISLVTFDKLATKSRDFNNSKLNAGNFPNSIVSNSYGTNIAAGLDMAISLMCQNGLDVDSSDSQWCTNISNVTIDSTKQKKLYTILFFDGGMDHVPSVSVGSQKLNAIDIINNNEKIEKYYKNFSTSQGTNSGISDSSVSFGNYVRPSIDRLKDNLNVNLFMIGYEFEDTKDYMKMAASSGDKLCVGSSYVSDGVKYCYYDAKTANLDDILNTILNNIVNDSGISSLKFTISSTKKDERALITMLKPDESEVENNRLEIKFEDLNTYTEDLKNNMNGYKFILNDSVYRYCSDSDYDDENKCKLSVELFNVVLDVEYIDGTKYTVSMNPPKFDLVLTESKTVN